MIIQIGTEFDESRILWKRKESDEWKRADIDDLIRAYEDSERTEWIPVSERLPEVGDTYIVSGRMKYDFEKEYTYFTDCAEYLPIGSTDGTEWETWTDWYEGQQEYEILAWQPLPEPYKESEDI